MKIAAKGVNQFENSTANYFNAFLFIINTERNLNFET